MAYGTFQVLVLVGGVFSWCLTWIMGRMKGKVHEKGLILVVTFNKIDGAVGKDIRRVGRQVFSADYAPFVIFGEVSAISLPLVVILDQVGIFLWKLTGWIPIPERHAEMVHQV